MNEQAPQGTRGQVRGLLRELPEPDVPPALWQRVRRGQQSMRRNRLLGAGGTLAIALCAVAFLQLSPPALDAARETSVAFQPPANGTDADIRAIDIALQNAYAQGMSDADISPLWHERERLMSIRNTRKNSHAPRGGQA